MRESNAMDGIWRGWVVEKRETSSPACRNSDDQAKLAAFEPGLPAPDAAGRASSPINLPLASRTIRTMPGSVFGGKS
jgi:hypothetical protein